MANIKLDITSEEAKSAIEAADKFLDKSKTFISGKFVTVNSSLKQESSIGFETNVPLTNDTANAGTSNTVSRGDHKHPADSTRASLVVGNQFSGINQFVNTVQIGDPTLTNFTFFEADGMLSFHGTATCYLDAIVPFIYKGGAGEAILATFVGGVRQLKFLVADFIDINNTEAPHDYKEGSGLELHLHWSNNSAMIAGDKVQWKLECAFANVINGVNTGTIFCDPATPTVFGT